MPNWSSQRAFNGPPKSQPRCQGYGSQSNYLSPFCKASSLPLERQQAACSPVASLLFGCCPVAIAFFVVAVVVAAFNAMLRRRAWPHVVVKCLERLPLLAYTNVATTVAMEIFPCIIFAATPNLLPRYIFGSPAHSVFFSANNPQRSSSHTSAASAFFGEKFSCWNGAFFAAFTPTKPMRLSTSLRSFGKNSPAPKLLSVQVCEFGVTSGRLCFSHLNLLNRFNVVRTARQHQLPSRLHFSRMFSSSAISTCSSF